MNLIGRRFSRITEGQHSKSELLLNKIESKGEKMKPLNEKVALVTGASRGIGRACAIALAAAGADIAVNYLLQEEKAKETISLVAQAGKRAVLAQADVSQAEQVNRMVQGIEQQLGPIDVLVNNAGIAIQKPFDQITEEDWDRTIAINLKSAFLLTKAVIPGMRARRFGRIINISSGAAQVGGVVGPHYAASKAGLHGLTHGYASLLAKEGITVNAVAPSIIETEMLANNPKVNPSIVPVGRFGTPQEIADVVVMVAQNGYMTGQTIFVNGGRYMT
jgi:3-oxoacyl-[acyl-carrier protein] reductase